MADQTAGDGRGGNKSSGAVGVEDMIHIPDLTEESLVANLLLRYGSKQIYTYVGTILVAVNPYELLEIYGDELLRTYNALRMSDLPPHIFAIANEAHYALLNTRASQCILISGESGAGKTESTKLLLQSLTALSHSHQWVEEQILEANTVLEAFGNAKTVRNDNSSRFGKYVAVQFDINGKVLGARIINYLLEKSRVTLVPEDERNFHVFYHLVKGASESERSLYALRPDENYYRYLANSGKVNNMDDKQFFDRLKISFNVVGFKPEQLKDIFSILSAILLLGNITFSSAKADAPLQIVAENGVMEKMCEFLGIEKDDISSALTRRSMLVEGQFVFITLTMDKANETRESLAKMIYSGLFQWIVDTTNTRIVAQTIKPTESMLATIGVLDIFGFENFKSNSFEQFCINFANEQLQQYFNRYIFANEQQEYAKQGIDWSKIDFKDNQATLELFTQKHTGLLAIMDEESGLPNATDATLLEKLHVNQKNQYYVFQQKTNRTHFGVVHYAGDVQYKIDGFLNKNRDALNPDVAKIMGASTSDIVSVIFAPKHGGEAAAMEASSKKMTIKNLKKALHQVTVSSQFQESLVKLIDMLDKSQPHFIRCIKPNEQKVPRNFDNPFVTTQLRYTGLLETVRIRKLGFPSRHVFEEFITRFGMLTKPMKKSPKGTSAEDQKTMSKEILAAVKVSESSWQLGHEKVFLRNEAKTKLEQNREVVVNKAANTIQRVFRAWRVRRIFVQKRKAARIIQKYTRRMIARQKFITVRNAVTRICATWKMYHQHKKYLKMRKAAVTIQKVFRGHKAKVAYKTQRSAIVLLEAAIKKKSAVRYIARLKKERELLEEARKRSEAEATRLREEQLKRQREEEKRIAEEKRVAEQKRIADEKRVAEETRNAQERMRVEEERRKAEEKKQHEERERRLAEEKRRQEIEEQEMEEQVAFVLEPMVGRNILPSPATGAASSHDASTPGAAAGDNVVQDKALQHLQTHFIETAGGEVKATTTKPTGNSKYEMVVLQVTKPADGFGMSIHSSKKKTGFKIDVVAEGSYAQELDLNVGDMIIAINGVPVASWKYSKVVDELKNDRLNNITVLKQKASEVPITVADVAPESDAPKKKGLFSDWDTSSDIAARRNVALDEAWVRDIKQLCPDLPLPIRPVDRMTPEEVASRRTALHQYNFSKYAALFFGPKQTPVYNKGEVLTKPLLVSTSKRKNLEPHALEFQTLLRFYMDPGNAKPADTKIATGENVIETLKLIVSYGIKYVDLRDEFYSQICKFINGNKDNAMCARGWLLIGICTGIFPPSKEMEPYMEQFIIFNGLFGFEHYSWRGFRRVTMLKRTRVLPPSRLEIVSTLAQAQFTLPVQTELGSTLQVTTGRVTANGDLLAMIGHVMGVKNLQGFGITVNNVSMGDVTSVLMDAISAFDEGAVRSADRKALSLVGQPLELRLRKETAWPDETAPNEPVVIDLIYRQIITFAKTQLRCGLEAAVTTLAAQQVVDLNGDLPNDHPAKIVKHNSADLQAILATFKGEPGYEDASAVAKQIAQRAVAFKALHNNKDKTAKDVKLELYNKSKLWPQMYVKVFKGKVTAAVHTFAVDAPVHILLGATSFSIATPNAVKSNPLTFNYTDISSMLDAVDNLVIIAGEKATRIALNCHGEIVGDFVKTQMRKLKLNSPYVIAAGSQTVENNSLVPLLDFKKEDVILLTDRDAKSLWWKGYLAEDPEKEEGSFPKELVRVLCGDFTFTQAALFQLKIDNEDLSYNQSGVLPNAAGSASAAGGASSALSKLTANSSANKGKEEATEQDSRLLSYATKYIRTVFAPPAQVSGIKSAIRNTMVGTIKGTFKGGLKPGASTQDLKISNDLNEAPTAGEKKDRQPPTADAVLRAISFTKEPITEALHLELNKNSDRKLASEVFQSIMKVMGDYPSKRNPAEIMITIVDKAQGLVSEEWRDEILLQVVKQTNGNKSKHSLKRGWDLMGVLCCFLMPSARFAPILRQFIEDNVNLGEPIATGAKWSLRNLKRMLTNGMRRYSPDLTEVEAIISMRPVYIRIFFPVGFSPAFQGMQVDSLATTKEAIASLSERVAIEDVSLNGIYRFDNGIRSLIPNDRLLMDVLQEIWIESVKKNVDAGNDRLCRLEFRKKLFFVSSYEDSSPAVANLIYLQSLENFRSYAVASLDDTVEIASLLLRLRSGDKLSHENIDGLVRAIVPPQQYTEGTPAEWVQWVTNAFNKRKGMTNPAEILKTLNQTFMHTQFYGCDYFEVNQIYDHTIPAKVTIGINSMNLFVIDTEKRTVLTKYRYGDITAWSASDDRLSLKIGNMVGGSRFIADTNKGTEICSLLDSYVQAQVRQKKRSQFMTVGNARQSMLTNTNTSTGGWNWAEAEKAGGPVRK